MARIVRKEVVDEFAKCLLWPATKRREIRVGRERVVWFEAEMEGRWLQVNTRPRLQAIVCCPEERIYTYFRPVNLAGINAARTEAGRLSALLLSAWFATARNRRVFLRMHPELGGWTNERLARESSRVVE